VAPSPHWLPPRGGQALRRPLLRMLLRDWPEGIVRRKKDDGTYEVLFRCEHDFGPPYLAVVITEEEAKELVREHREEMYEEVFGEKL